MCDEIVKNVTLRNVPAVGESDDAFFVGKTSLQFIQIQDAWPIGLPTKNGFAPSSAKMSKDATVAVLGSRIQRDPNSNNQYPTNRQGLNIYLKKSCPSSKTCGNKNSFNDWVHFQSIIRNAEKELLQIDELAISKDGTTIVALDALLHILYVFERTNPCTADGKWYLQHTLVFDNVGLAWNKIALSEDGTKLLIRKTNSTQYSYCVLGRQRPQKKGKTCAEPTDGYKFVQIHGDLEMPVSFVAASHSAFSHDGRTVLIDAISNNIVNVLQYDFNCDKYVLVSQFLLHSTTAAIVDIKFGGSCSERLFILTQDGSAPIQYDVEIYSRLKNNNETLCVSKFSKRAPCCSDLNVFSALNRIKLVENAIYESTLIDNRFTHSLLTETVDGDLFMVVSILNNFTQNLCFYFNTVLTDPTIFVRLWKQQSCQSATEWCSCNFSDEVDFAKNLRYDVHQYDMLSFDEACQRYYFPFTQRITASLSTPVFVNDPDGCFYFCIFNGGGVPTQFYYFYRIHGDSDYIFFDESTAAVFPLLQCNNDDYIGVKLQFNDKNCVAKDLDVIVIDKTNVTSIPTAMDLVLHPEIITVQATIAMRLCFAVVDFAKRHK